MLRRGVSLLVILSLLAVPVTAQDEPTLQDDRGDVSDEGVAPSASAAVVATTDLISLTIQEETRRLTFVLEVDDLPETSPPEDIATQYYIEFKVGGQGYRIDMWRQDIPGLAPDSQAFFLARYDPAREFYQRAATLEGTVDKSADTLTVSVDRDLLRDPNGVPPGPDRDLEELVVTSEAGALGTFCLTQGDCTSVQRSTDRMPDDGSGLFDIALGIQQTGHARLFSTEPFRASNGAATTFVYEVEAHNVGDEDDRFSLAVSGVPSEWDVTVPATSLEIPAGGSIDVPIVLHTAFAHAHGSSTEFLLEMISASDPGAVGRLQLGVFYPEPPQPAGHHDTMWVHSIDLGDDPLFFALATALETSLGASGSLQQEYFNTLEEDPVADEVPIEPYFECGLHLGEADYPVGTSYCWEIPLGDALMLGLDFDLERTGTLDATFSSDLPLPSSQVTGQVLYVPPPEDGQNTPQGAPVTFFNRDTTVLAHLNGTTTQDIGAMGTGSYSLVVEPTPESDLIPYKPGASMLLTLELKTLRPSNFFLGPDAPPPKLLPGARLQLPLNEYADPVKDVLDFGDGLSLKPLGEQQRLVNPGKTALFEATLTNTGEEDDRVSLKLIGKHHEWGRLLGPDEISLAAGESMDVAVAITVPEGTQDGEMADLVLEAGSAMELGKRALLRVVAEADTDGDHPDDAEAAGLLEKTQDKKSPGAAPVFLLAGLAAVAYIHRTRRRD